MGSAIAIQIEPASRLFHALSEPIRLQILEQLKDGERCVCELTETFHTGQSRLSFHLRVLKAAGLITDRPEGRWTYYALNEEAFEEAEELIRTLKKAAKGSRSNTRCC